MDLDFSSSGTVSVSNDDTDIVSVLMVDGFGSIGGNDGSVIFSL